MKIIAIADQHGMLDMTVPSCDLLIVGGDNCPDSFTHENDHWEARNDPDRQLQWFMNDWMDWRLKQPVQDCVVTWGNHDFCGELQKESRVCILHGDGRKTYIVIDNEVEIGGVRIWLTPWTKQFKLWAFMREEQRLADAHYKWIPPGIDILVTHDPPFGYGDRTPDWITGIPAHHGSRAMLDTVGRVKPKAVVCGHIHDAYGKYELPVCATVHDMSEGYVPVYNCAMTMGRVSLGTAHLVGRVPMEIEL